ncbi:DeoR/GlpR family DNA-binding transcription regulator [Paratractidigestivibacter faecalis]|uniref:DeoR/GlpR family DNA-binding transcription regulator n=1 Tax=Paratractidigestivibacter faecalis TaxID=2292441 RepID=A0ABV1IFY9_9ACTN
MKRSKALVASRRDEITAILERRGQVSVAELAEHFDVSALTIRRDLDYLESQQVLTRQYGTATLLNPFGRPSGSRQIRANKAIAREAARHVEDGDCIFINTSSTALGLLEFITAQDVTVITNNGKALMLEERQNVSVLLTGGEIRPPRASMTGEIAMETIKRVTAAKSFLGCTGLSANFGLTSATSPEPAINSVMLEHSKQHVIVADSSKIGLTSSFQFGSIDEIDLLITDTGVSDDQVQFLKAYGVKEIVRVEPVLSPIDYDPITTMC